MKIHKCQSVESELTLQLFLDRAIKAMLKFEAEASTAMPIAVTTATEFTQRERNAMRYMAGYVIVAFLKKYKRPIKNPALLEKYALYSKILSHLKAEQQPIQMDSLLDYTRIWSELIDRGGVYHVNKKVSCIHALYIQNQFILLLYRCFN